MPRLPPELRAMLERRLDPHRRARFITDEVWEAAEEKFKRQKGDSKLVEVIVQCGGAKWLLPLRKSGPRYLCSVMEPLNIHMTATSLDTFRSELEWFLSEIDEPLSKWVAWWKEQNDESRDRRSPTYSVRRAVDKLRDNANRRVRRRKASDRDAAEPPSSPGTGTEG